MADYIDNKRFHREYSVWKEQWVKNKEAGIQSPQVSDYLAECIMLLSQRMARRPNFRSYSYVDEMIGDAVENCLRYFHCFNPDYPNIFGYFSAVVNNAFIRRIKKEQREDTTKSELIRGMDISEFIDGDPETQALVQGFFDSVKLDSVMALKPERVVVKAKKAAVRQPNLFNVDDE